MNVRIEIWSQTDTGKVREHNEDSFLVAEDLAQQRWGIQKEGLFSLGSLGSVLAVADGMGGANAGEIASDIAVKEVRRQFSSLQQKPEDVPTLLKKVILAAHQAIVHHANHHPKTKGMGTTLILAWFIEGMLYVAWSGDSRCYLYREGIELRPLTDDHSLVWEMVKNGILTAEEARTHPDSNIITQSLGNQREAPKPEVLRQAIPLQAGDRLLICSDGLNSMIPDIQIAEVLSGSESPRQMCRSLITRANQAGGYDNITTLMLHVVDIQESSSSITATPPVTTNEVSTPPIAIPPISPPSDTSQTSRFSWLWIVGGILFFGSLTLAAVFWVGKQMDETPNSPKIPQGSEMVQTDTSTTDSIQQEPLPAEMGTNHPDPVDTGNVEKETSRNIPTISEEQPADSDNLSSEETGNESSVTSSPNTELAVDLDLVQQKVRRILNQKYALIRYDRLEILQYKNLTQSQKANLNYIQSRVLNKGASSIYQDLNKVVRLGGEGQNEILELRDPTSDPMPTLDKLLQELARFELIIQQMEQ